jgi:hypothetical protein
MTVGATKPLGPLPDHQPETQASGASARANRGVADGIVNQPISGPSSRSTGYTTFTKLCREDTDDIADFEEAKPQVPANKRAMFADDVEEESSRPVRRVVSPVSRIGHVPSSLEACGFLIIETLQRARGGEDGRQGLGL